MVVTDVTRCISVKVTAWCCAPTTTRCPCWRKQAGSIGQRSGGSRSTKSRKSRWTVVDNTPFTPDWISPPGDTIATILKERGLTPDEFAKSIHRTPADVEELLEGRGTLTEDIARRLAAVLGATEAFWTRRE